MYAHVKISQNSPSRYYFEEGAGNTYAYTYNDEGVRTSKTINSVVHTYHLSGSQIFAEEWGSNIVFYLYDADGSPIGMAARPAFCKFLSFAHGEDAALPVDFLSPNARFVSYRQFCIIIQNFSTDRATQCRRTSARFSKRCDCYIGHLLTNRTCQCNFTKDKPATNVCHRPMLYDPISEILSKIRFSFSEARIFSLSFPYGCTNFPDCEA